MKTIFCFLFFFSLSGCMTNQKRWEDHARENQCVETGNKKVLLAGSVYTQPQRRTVYQFICSSGYVWSDRGNYAKHNEWLSIQ